MGELIDKAKGAINEAIGKGKQHVAENNDDSSLAAEGAVQEGKGKTQNLSGSVKGALGDDI